MPSDSIDLDATAPSARRGAEGPEPGKTWARYRIREVLGEGGMGQVFAAYDVELDREIALKVLHDEQLGLAGQERLRREARAMARVAHPNVVPVYEVGEHAGRSYYTMERVRGRSLKQWLSEPRSWREVQRVFLEAARGLAAIHAAGLVHRDVKPGNLLVGDDGRARVVDLGIAAADADVAGVPIVDTTTLRGAGTPAYMAPEQLGMTAVDARADQFAFGVTLYEALHGRSPFDGDTAVSRLAAIHDGPRPPVRRVPRWLDEVWRRAVATDPAERFPDVDALAEALAGPRTRRWPLAIAALVVVAAVSAVAVAGVARRSRSFGDDACLGAGRALVDVWGPGRRDALVARLGSSPFAGALARRLDTLTGQWQLAATAVCHRAHHDPLWSPDADARASSCLVDRRRELAAVTAKLDQLDPASAPDVTVLQVTAPLACLDREFLDNEILPPADPIDAALVAMVMGLQECALGELQDGAIAPAEATLAALEPLIARIDYAPIHAQQAQYRAFALQERGDGAGAVKLLEDDYYAERGRGADGPALATVASLIETTSHTLGDLDLAERWARIGGADASRRPDSVETLQVDFTVAALESERGDYAASEAFARSGLALARRLVGDEDSRTAALVEMLAIALDSSGRTAEAVPLYQQDLASLRSWYGDDSRHLAPPLQDLALAESALGHHDQAIAYGRRAVALLEGDGSQDLGAALLNLGTVIGNAGHPGDAVPVLERAVTTLRAALGDNHPDVALAVADLAWARGQGVDLADPQAVARSAAELAAAVDAARASVGADNPQTADAEINLADFDGKVDRCADAIAPAKHALAVYDASGNAVAAAGAREDLARCEIVAHHGAAAVALLEAAIAARQGGDPAKLATDEQLLAAARAIR